MFSMLPVKKGIALTTLTFYLGDVLPLKYPHRKK